MGRQGGDEEDEQAGEDADWSREQARRSGEEVVEEAGEDSSAV